MKNRRNGRIAAIRLASGIVLAVTVVCIPGCATPPDRDDTIATINEEIERLKKEREADIKRCDGNQACIDAVEALYRELISEAQRLRGRVIDEAWQDAREIRKQLRKRLLELIPQFPELRDLFEDLIRLLDSIGGDVDVEALPRSGGTTSSALSAPAPLIEITYDLAGTVEAFDWLVVGQMAIGGTLEVSGSETSGAFSGTVTSGSVEVTLPGGAVLTAAILEGEPALPSTLTTNASGVGEISLVLDLDDAVLDANPQWGVVLGSPTIIRLPVTMAADHALSFQHTGLFGAIFPHVPWPASDYDDNGVLDPNTDLAAFMAGHDAHEALADKDFNDIWDQADVTLWQLHFDEDYNQ